MLPEWILCRENVVMNGRSGSMMLELNCGRTPAANVWYMKVQPNNQTKNDSVYGTLTQRCGQTYSPT